jgi:hypothetical protein
VIRAIARLQLAVVPWAARHRESLYVVSYRGSYHSEYMVRIYITGTRIGLIGMEFQESPRFTANFLWYVDCAYRPPANLLFREGQGHRMH